MPDSSMSATGPPVGGRRRTVDGRGHRAGACCVCGIDGVPVYRLPPFGVVRCPVCELVFVSPRLSSQALQRLYDEPGYFEGGVYGAQSAWSPAMVLQRTWTAGRLGRRSAGSTSRSPAGDRQRIRPLPGRRQDGRLRRARRRTVPHRR